MSKLYDMRRTLADKIIAADIGWTMDTVLLKRQTDLWNDVATAIASAANGAVLHIGIADGAGNDGNALLMELTLTLTILVLPVVTDDGATPEEDLWEDLVKFVHGLRVGDRDHCLHEFRFKSFSDGDLQADGGTQYLARQTIFTKSLYMG